MLRVFISGEICGWVYSVSLAFNIRSETLWAIGDCCPLQAAVNSRRMGPAASSSVCCPHVRYPPEMPAVRLKAPSRLRLVLFRSNRRMEVQPPSAYWLLSASSRSVQCCPTKYMLIGPDCCLWSVALGNRFAPSLAFSWRAAEQSGERRGGSRG